MSRQQALKIVTVVGGLFFLAGIYPLAMSIWFWPRTSDVVPMFLSLYVTLGVFLLIAARNPQEHRSLILFAVWSSFAHAAVMLAQAYSEVAGRPELYGMSVILVVIGVPLIALMPGGTVGRARGYIQSLDFLLMPRVLRLVLTRPSSRGLARIAKQLFHDATHTSAGAVHRTE